MVPCVELIDHRHIIGMGPLATIGARRRPLHERKGDDHALRRSSLGSRPPFHEHDDRTKHRFGRGEIALVRAQLGAGVAHHHGPVARQAHARDALQAELSKAGKELVGVARFTAIESQLDLCCIDASAKETRQRLKHFVGPGTKSLSDCDHSRVATSILSSESRMLFTDEGLPPRMRFETVPAVEMTVPFFVCSM